MNISMEPESLSLVALFFLWESIISSITCGARLIIPLTPWNSVNKYNCTNYVCHRFLFCTFKPTKALLILHANFALLHLSIVGISIISPKQLLAQINKIVQNHSQIFKRSRTWILFPDTIHSYANLIA